MNTEAYNKMMKEMAPGAFTAWWSMIQADAELAGEPIKPEAVVLHCMGNGASATVTASALDEVCRILAERATPAAASAGAAGKIDTPEFRALLAELRVAEERAASYSRPHREKAATDAYSAFIAHIDQHTAAAVASLQAALDATIKLTGEVIEDRNAEIERLRAATAPVSAAQAPTESKCWSCGGTGRVRREKCAYCIGAPQSAGAPVSAAEPEYDSEEARRETWKDGYSVGFEAAKGLFVPKADGRELPALQRAIDLVEQIAANTTADYRETAAQALLALRQPQQLPVLTRWNVTCTTDRMAPEEWKSDPQGDWVKYSDIAALAMRQPDPAGEWVKRADWARGQQGGAILAEIEKLLKGIDEDEASSPDGWWATSAGVEFGADVLTKIRALFEAKQAGKEST